MCGGGNSFGADLVSVNGPDKVPPAYLAHYTIIVKNSGTSDWPDGTKFEIANGSTSQLHADSWTSATQVTTVAATGAGKQATIDFDVMTPNVTADTPITQTFMLDDNGTMFGMINLALTVSPGADPGSNDEGGCNAGGGAGWLLLGHISLAALVMRRRRR
jgi:uncharacterized protein (TIGR03382 family)